MHDFFFHRQHAISRHPGFRDKGMSLSEEQMYTSRAELFQPDLATMWDVDYYQDVGHLNIEGGRWFSSELARYLIEHPLRQ